VDHVADEVQALLREHGLAFGLCVFFDAVTETLHAVGYDGAAARYFRALESHRGAGAPATGSPTAAPRDTASPEVSSTA
jgi:hypothetical protein